jgi:hypothetical protein
MSATVARMRGSAWSTVRGLGFGLVAIAWVFTGEACEGESPQGVIPEGGFPCPAVPAKCDAEDGGYFTITSKLCPDFPETVCNGADVAYAVCTHGSYGEVVCMKPASENCDASDCGDARGDR